MKRDEISALGLGFDVSHHNVDDRGSAINWEDAFKEGYRFVLIKATDGTGFIDPQFANNVNGAFDAGFAVGAYHFLRPQSDAGVQADFFLSQVNAIGLEKFQLGAAVDVEDPDDDKGAWTRIDHATRILKISHWLAAVEAVFPDRSLIYTSPDWWAGEFGMAADFSGHPLWAASPSHAPDLSGTTWTEWTIWQFDFTGTVSGVGDGNVDRDRTTP